MSETPQRFVKVNLTVPVVLSVPADSETGHIEFMINDSSSCADNYINDFLEQYKHRRAAKDCFCLEAEGKYVGEATPEDVKRFNAKKW